MSSTKKGVPKASTAPVKYSEGDKVLGKVRGYPPWPGKVVNPDTAPPNVKKERPMVKKSTYYCVRFYPTAEYAWLVGRDLSMLQQHEIESFVAEPHRKNAELMEGYKTALNPEEWENEQAAKAQQAAEEAAAMETDELQEDEAAPQPVVGKKRKRESIAGDKKAKKTKLEQLSKKRKGAAKPKTTSAEALESEDEQEAEEEPKPSTAAPAAPEKPAKPAKAAKPAADGEEEGEDSALAGDPEALKVKDWRHKLQKAFLGKGGPQSSDMAAADQQFKTVEDYKGLTIEYLQFSKIGKVMRKIAGLGNIPKDDEFHFKDRAQALVTKWHDQLQGQAPKPNGDAEPAGDVSKAEDVEMKDAEKETEKEAEKVPETKTAEPAVNGDHAGEAPAEEAPAAEEDTVMAEESEAATADA